MNAKPQIKKSAVVLSLLIVLFWGMTCGNSIVGQATSGGNPDTRAAEEVCKDFLHMEAGKHGKTIEYVNQALPTCIKVIARQIELMEFVSHEEPQEPTMPKKPECSKLKCPDKWVEYEIDMYSYQALLRVHPLQKKLYDENEKSRKEFVFVPTLTPSTKSTEEERVRGAGMLVHRDNIYGYHSNAKNRLTALYLSQLLSGAHYPYWKRQVEPIKDGYDAYLKNPPPEDSFEAFQKFWMEREMKRRAEAKEGVWKRKRKDKKELTGEKAEKAWLEWRYERYITKAYLGRPLVSVKWADGSPVKSWDGLTLEEINAFKAAYQRKDWAAAKEALKNGRDCYLIEPLAELVTQANLWLYRASKGNSEGPGEELFPMVCWRSNLLQAAIWSMKGEGAHLPKASSVSSYFETRVAALPPGFSKHEQGLAMDVFNMRSIQPYLAAVAGMMCDFIDTDGAHCSFAEIKLTWLVVGKKFKLEATAYKQDVTDLLKEYGVKLPDIVNSGIDLILDL